MESHATLPEGYQEILAIDLQKDAKLALLVNGLAVAIMLIMVVAVFPFVSLADLISDGDTMALMLKLMVFGVGTLVYLVLHEAVHGVFMRRFCSAKVRFGFTGLYAFAGSDGFYCRKHYIIIALAPIVFWGVVLGILNAVVPASWFLVVYAIQVMNISGAAGDLYVSWRMSRLPADILVRDTGVAMTVFSRRQQ